MKRVVHQWDFYCPKCGTDGQTTFRKNIYFAPEAAFGMTCPSCQDEWVLEIRYYTTTEYGEKFGVAP